MAVLVWDKPGEHFYETGVRKPVLYVQAPDGSYPKGVAWNGMTGVTESPTGAEFTALYANDSKYLNLQSAEEFGGTIEAYTYPDEFKQCNGEAELVPGVSVGQQSRTAFGFCYRTAIGNDIEGAEHAYMLHIVYGCLVTPSERAYSTINESPEAVTLSWEFATTPVSVPNMKPTSILKVDSRAVDPDELEELEKLLYGDTSTEASLPLPDEVAAIFVTTPGP